MLHNINDIEDVKQEAEHIRNLLSWNDGSNGKSWTIWMETYLAKLEQRINLLTSYAR